MIQHHFFAEAMAGAITLNQNRRAPAISGAIRSLLVALAAATC